MQHRKRPRRLRTAILLAASILLAAALSGGAVWHQTENDRRFADSYRKTLAVAHGKYLRTVPVDGINGNGAARAGYVFAYQGSPAWLFVTMTAARQSGAYQIALTTRDGREVRLGAMAIRDVHGAWGTTVPVAVHDILVMRFNGPGGHELLARFG
jgi:hypothetical protein